MPDYADLVHVAGKVGRDPITRDSAKGPIVKFTVAETIGYGEDREKNTKWWDVAVFKEALHPAVLANIFKGADVVLEGSASKRDQYNDIIASRVGLVSWLTRVQPAATDDLDNI